MSLSPFHAAPHALDPIASINQVRLVDLPTRPIEPEWRGRIAFDLLSPAALIEAVRRQGQALILPPGTPDGEVLRWFEARLDDRDPAVAEAVDDIVRAKARALAHLLLTLKTGANRKARPDWGEAHWAWWAGVERVIFGGGLIRGLYGSRLTAETSSILSRSGGAKLELELSAWGADLPSVGLARFARRGVKTALVCDFGGTDVKRAIASYDGTALLQLRRLPVVSSGCVPASEHQAESPEEVWGRMWQVLTRAWHPDVDAALISLACYVMGGQPVERGCYGPLRDLSNNFESFVGRELSAWAGRTVAARVLHDGDAAAASYAGTSRAAVLVLGSAIGVGFVPPEEGLLPLRNGFSLA